MSLIRLAGILAICLVCAPGVSVRGEDAAPPDDSQAARELAARVTIYRDAWGVPHIDGEDDEATIFGFAYAQAEDFFWQVEDSYILGLGRYAEVHGATGINSDLMNRAFEIVPRSQADYPKLSVNERKLLSAFAAGLNYYLATHPEVKPRLITHFEPWQVVAFGRQTTIELCFRYTRLSNTFMPRMLPNISAAVGSNAWAIAPDRTKNGHAMLLANPHMPWFGLGTMYEAHLRSGEGWNFTGATFYGSPLPNLGHNEHAGWTFTVNEIDVADVWRETFDHPTDPLLYRYGDGYRRAESWQETVNIKTPTGLQEKVYTFRKTHHGPIVEKLDDHTALSAAISRLHDALLMRESLQLVRAHNVDEFKAALGMLDFPIMNAIYADKRGDIFYVYNGAVPRRDPQFDWSKPLDGSDPRTEWQGLHPLSELPQVLNPASGYVQNCNSSPFVTTDGDNPVFDAFPPYMIEDKDTNNRRSQRSRQILGSLDGATFEDVELLAFDTKMYWAAEELPRYAKALEDLQTSHPDLAARVRPYVEHLLAWDYRATPDSTAATLCVEWYQELFGPEYPGEVMRPQYAEDIEAQFVALFKAAAKLKAIYGDWRMPYGDVHRAQRIADVVDVTTLPFSDQKPSLPFVGVPGPLGAIFTEYFTPPVEIPFVRSLKRQYGAVGITYMAVYEFGEKIRGSSVVQFGTSGDPESPHFFDQAELVAKQRLKPELFYWEDVRAAAQEVYHPGEREAAKPGS